MAEKKRKKEYDPKLALLSADAFLNQAKPFLNRIGTEMGSAPARAAEDLGGLVASATALALAVELYLKALWMLLGKSVPEHHNIWTLYKHLPNNKLKNAIQSAFDDKNQTQGEAVVAIEIALSIGPMDENELRKSSEESAKKNRDSSLKGILTRSSDAFVVWRYLHEQASPGEVRIIGYEFGRIHLLAKILRNYVVRCIDEAQRTSTK